MTFRSPGTGAIISPHHLANRSGARVLEEGGNAIEAAVAASAALAVVYPHFCGIGGEAIWIVADRSGNAICLMGVGQAATALPDFKPGGVLPTRGGGSALTSACAVDTWDAALRWSWRHWDGRFEAKRLLEDAIAYAKDGFSRSGSQLFWTRFRCRERDGWQGFADRFAPEGLGDDDVFKQPELADSLRRLADDGLRSFYDGPLSHEIAAGLAAMGSPLRPDDLAATSARQTIPLRKAFAGMELLAPPPPSQGMTTLQILSVLEAAGIAKHRPGSALFYHLCIEAVKQAFLERDRIADPDCAKIETYIDDATIDRMAAALSAERALAWPHLHRTADTAFLAVADRDGRTVSALQSIYYDWGSGCVVGDTGILWHNRGSAFSTSPDHPNAIAPRKRPFCTLNPGIGLRQGKPSILYGTQGADGQPQTLSVLVSALAACGMDPESALRMPRFLLGRTFSDSRDTLKFEVDVGEATLAALADLEHDITPIAPLSPLAGQAGAIVMTSEGHIAAAHDPRGDGGAVFVPALDATGGAE